MHTGDDRRGTPLAVALQAAAAVAPRLVALCELSRAALTAVVHTPPREQPNAKERGLGENILVGNMECSKKHYRSPGHMVLGRQNHKLPRLCKVYSILRYAI